MKFAYLLYNSTEKCMKLTKFGILANKTTFSFTSVRESNISRGCAKILEILEGTGVNFRCRFWKNSEGRGAIRQIPSVRVVWIFSEEEVTRVFSSTSNIAWQFWMKLATRNFTANSNTHVCKFGRTKIWYSHCPDLFVYTSSGLAFFLMQWVKSTVIFPLRPCFKFSCGQELFQQFLRDLSAKGIHLSIVEINRKYTKLTKFVSDLSA